MLRRNVWRWAPAIVAPIVIASGVLVAGSAAATALPDKTPAQVLTLAAKSSVTAFSGTVQATESLGLPDLSGLSGTVANTAGGNDLGSRLSSTLDLLTGTHSARVFADGPSKLRVQIMDTLAERDLVVNGRSAWLYDSAAETATQFTLPDPKGAAPTGPRTPGDFENPANLAKTVLAELDVSTEVSLGADVNVAGRAAYDLVLTPKAADTLIGSVSIAVDGSTGMPLRVQIRARGAHDPAVSLGFTSIDLARPSSALFSFTPPKGTDISRNTVTPPTGPSGSTATSTEHRPTVLGQGWDAIVELPAGSLSAAALTNPMLAELTTPVAGGRVLGTSLVNVLVTDSGEVFAGAVPVSRLESAAAAG